MPSALSTMRLQDNRSILVGRSGPGSPRGLIKSAEEKIISPWSRVTVLTLSSIVNAKMQDAEAARRLASSVLKIGNIFFIGEPIFTTWFITVLRGCFYGRLRHGWFSGFFGYIFLRGVLIGLTVFLSSMREFFSGIYFEIRRRSSSSRTYPSATTRR